MVLLFHFFELDHLGITAVYMGSNYQEVEPVIEALRYYLCTHLFQVLKCMTSGIHFEELHILIRF